MYRFLTLASERAESLDVESAARWARKAADIAPDDVSRARALVTLSSLTSGGSEEVLAMLGNAIDLYATAGDDLGRAVALAHRSRAAWYGGNRELADSQVLAALELIDGMPDSVEVASVWAEHSAMLMFAGREEEAVEVAERVIRVARDVGDVRLRARGLRLRERRSTWWGTSTAAATATWRMHSPSISTWATPSARWSDTTIALRG